MMEHDPAEALWFWKEMHGLRSVGVRAVFARLPMGDPAQAQRYFDRLHVTNLTSFRSDFYAFLALGLKANDAPASHRALDELLLAMDGLMKERPEQLQTGFRNLLPIIERIDPALVPEVFWRYVASRPPSANARHDQRLFPDRSDPAPRLVRPRSGRRALRVESRPDRAYRGPRAGDLVLRIRGLVVVRPPRRGGSTRENPRRCRPEPERHQDPCRRLARPLRQAAFADAVAGLSGCLGKPLFDNAVPAPTSKLDSTEPSKCLTDLPAMRTPPRNQKRDAHGHRNFIRSAAAIAPSLGTNSHTTYTSAGSTAEPRVAG